MTLSFEETATIVADGAVGIAENMAFFDTKTNANIVFSVNNTDEVMRVGANGDFFVNGRKVVNDIEVYNGLVSFLSGQGLYNKEKS